MIASYEYWKEYYRVVGTLYVHEDGLFRELPTDITSGFITVDVVYRIAFMDDAGRIRVQDLSNKPGMDKDKVQGGDITIDGQYWYTEGGGGLFTLDCVTVYSDMSNNNPELAEVAGYMHTLAVNDIGFNR